MKKIAAYTAALVVTASACFGAAAPAMAQSASAEDIETYKTITMACAAIYQDQLDRKRTSNATATTAKRDAMLGLYAILAEKDEAQAKADVAVVTGNIPSFDPTKLAELTAICDKLTEE